MPRFRDPITYKQKRFIQEYIKNGGNATKAVLSSYDTDRVTTAKKIGSNNLKNPTIQEQLNKALSKYNARVENVVEHISSIAVEEPVKGYSGAEILEANKTLLKLHGVLTDKKQIVQYNLNASYSNLSEYELLELRNKKKQDTDTILNDT